MKEKDGETQGTSVENVGGATDGRMVEGEAKNTITTRQGHPVSDNQNSRTVGNRGPTTLENYQFLEKITHFDRERIPERVVHARGAGAHGFFEATGKVGDEPISKYTRAKLFQEDGKRTPVFVRFSSVIHGGHSPETLRDPRGFATKFYTEDGNWDLVGNNLKVFFIRDAVNFPDLVHAFKPDPVTNRQDGARIFDFISHKPEAMHMITFLFSPWGIPANYREMQGSGVNTYKWINDAGEGVLVKYHWVPKAGVRNLTQADAEKIQGKDFNHATGDLYDAIERGEFPEWEFAVQIMSDGEHPELDFDPLDDTKLWPTDQFPMLTVGRMVLDRNPENYFAEVEQVAFGTGVLVDGLDFSDDKMLQGRTLSYSDTQRYRVGPNYLQVPINAPKKHVATNQRDGQMTVRVDLAPGANPHVNYEPSSLGGLVESPKSGADHTPFVQGHLQRAPIDRTNDFGQAGQTYRDFSEEERTELIANIVDNLSGAADHVKARMVWLFSQCDASYGQRVAEGIGIAVPTSDPYGGSVAGIDRRPNAGGELGSPATGGPEAAESVAHPAQPY